MDGLHLTADLRGCDAGQALMTQPEALRNVCLSAVEAAGLRAVGELFHRFEPVPAGLSTGSSQQVGITGVVLLAESHLAVHTWPELGAVTLDVYVCNFGADNSARAHALTDALALAFGPATTERHSLHRGRLVTPPATPSAA